MVNDSTVYYLYIDETDPNPMNDNIIELRYKGNAIEGYFWGNSDDYSEAREGYLPGFFILKMKDVKVKNDSIFFVLDSNNESYFSNPIDISIHSSKEAIKRGYHLWRQNFSFFYDRIGYKGTISHDGMMLNKTKYPYLNTHKFIRTSFDKIKKRNRRLSMNDEKKNVSFQSFLSRYFRPWKQTKVSMQIFGDFTIKDLMNEGLYAAYLPSSDLCSCKGDMGWQGGCYVQHKGFVIAFLHLFCMDGGHKEFMEDNVDNLVMVIYSKDGKVIDKRVIGKKSFLDFTRITGDIGKLIFTVEQGSIADVNKYSKYKDLDFTVTKHVYSIDKNQRIHERTVGKSWTETIKKKSKVTAEKSFADFLKMFPRWDKPYLNDSVFTSATYLGDEFERFIPGFQKRECETQELRWLSCYCLEQDSIYVLFVVKDCSIPCEGSYPYADDFILTYSKDGKLIDYCPIARHGDLWQVETKASCSPLTFTVRQGVMDSNEVNVDSPKHVSVSTYIYKVGENGKITKDSIK